MEDSGSSKFDVDKRHKVEVEMEVDVAFDVG